MGINTFESHILKVITIQNSFVVFGSIKVTAAAIHLNKITLYTKDTVCQMTVLRVICGIIKTACYFNNIIFIVHNEIAITGRIRNIPVRSIIDLLYSKIFINNKRAAANS